MRARPAWPSGGLSIRLQCYEGLDESKALYEWDYAKQVLYTQLLRESVAAETAGAKTFAEAVQRVARADVAFFSPSFLIARPLLRALAERRARRSSSSTKSIAPMKSSRRSSREGLAENQATIPEIGTIHAKRVAARSVDVERRPRDMTDALRRRYLHLCSSITRPRRAKIAILEMHLPESA